MDKQSYNYAILKLNHHFF